MPYTFANLKRDLRGQIWPAGEARNQFISHNTAFIEAMVDILTWVDCWQIDNTQLVPHCSTLFNCGLTWFEAPRGIIRRVSAIEKVDSYGEPSADGEDDWCKEIVYTQVDFCHISKYLSRSSAVGCCTNIPLYFALPLALCGKGNVPVPTDEGLDPSLPVLPLGNKYPQESTDADSRALSGVWAMNRGRIYIAPWIQSTETVVIRWDGIKREWADGDLIEEDPKLKRAVECYVRADHERKFEKNEPAAQQWDSQYNLALSNLIHDCRQENLQRECRGNESTARGSRITNLYYNDAQQYTASCPPDQEGEPVTVTIAADTVGSTISKADANAKALEQARTQAEDQLECEVIPVTYFNEEQSFTASCAQTEDHPPPDGAPVTVTIAAGLFSSTVSQAAANALAFATAQGQAEALLSCTYWNKEVTYTAECPPDTIGDDATITIPAHTISSQISELVADQEAAISAQKQAEEALTCTEVFYNTQQSHIKQAGCIRCPGNGVITIIATVPADYMTSIISQADANDRALNHARLLAESYWQVQCLQIHCGTFHISPEGGEG